jgi:hypothetical protein
MADVPSNVAPATKKLSRQGNVPGRHAAGAVAGNRQTARLTTWRTRSSWKSAASCSPPGRSIPAARKPRKPECSCCGQGSFEEAEAIAKEDPLHKAGLRTFTLQKWRVNEGRITVTVDFSDQTMKIE